MPRNPRANIPEDKFCEYIYPDDHPTKAGQRCKAIKKKGSKFCHFHQPDPEARKELLEQLEKAREKAIEANTKHGYYTTTYKECNNCALADICDYYEPGKKVCDFQVQKEKVDLSSLESIERAAGKIINEQLKRMKKMELFFKTEPESTEIFEASTRCAKRVLSMLKDYAVIKEKYEKNTKTNPWEDILDNI